uniref:Uncharacterized protein n=1 Tax=Arundo donax TaxID=35708 RepID=A0A0A9F8B6_ARUDO
MLAMDSRKVTSMWSDRYVHTAQSIEDARNSLVTVGFFLNLDK